MDIYCLHCNYNLQGIPAGRCPECGREFNPNHQETFRRPQSPAERFQDRHFWRQGDWWSAAAILAAFPAYLQALLPLLAGTYGFLDQLEIVFGLLVLANVPMVVFQAVKGVPIVRIVVILFWCFQTIIFAWGLWFVLREVPVPKIGISWTLFVAAMALRAIGSTINRELVRTLLLLGSNLVTIVSWAVVIPWGHLPHYLLLSIPLIIVSAPAFSLAIDLVIVWKSGELTRRE